MEKVTLNNKEQKRLLVLNEVLAGRVTGQEASEVLGLSLRHTRRLLAAYREAGGGWAGPWQPWATAGQQAGGRSGRGDSASGQERIPGLQRQALYRRVSRATRHQGIQSYCSPA